MKHGEHLAWPDQSSENNIQLIRNSHGIENLALSSLTSIYKRTKIQGFRFLKIRAICILNISFTGASHASWQSLTWLHLYFHPRHHHSTSNIIRVILQCIEHFKIWLPLSPLICGLNLELLCSCYCLIACCIIILPELTHETMLWSRFSWIHATLRHDNDTLSRLILWYCGHDPAVHISRRQSHNNNSVPALCSTIYLHRKWYFFSR